MFKHLFLWSITFVLSVLSDSQVERSGETANLAGTLDIKGEARPFQAEVNKLMHLIINSLYSKKEIFLRELISNAADALDKVRLHSLTNPNLGSELELTIKIRADKPARLLHIVDTGIGMSESELHNNLGQIAHSGTAEFLKTLKAEDSKNLIGQFGVGFYSAFLVSDKVTVKSKSATDDQYLWVSNSSSYVVARDEAGPFVRGTTVTLHIKNDSVSFLEQEKLEKLIKTYSQFIDYPIYLYKVEEQEVEVEDEEKKAEWEKKKAEKEARLKEKEEAGEKEGTVVDKHEEEDDIGDEPPKKTITKTIADYALMNSVKPLWARDPSEVTKDEYHSFYKSFTEDEKPPLAYVHFKVEGNVPFRALLYIPRKAPFEILDNLNPKSDISFHVNRIFITKDLGDDFLRKYISFVKGFCDATDFPLQVSRESVRRSNLRIVGNKITKKVLDLIKNLAKDPEEYYDFWKEYSKFIKLGVAEGDANKERLAALLRYQSSYTIGKDEKALTSLEDYVSRMKKNQKVIYFLSCQTIYECKTSPLSENLIKFAYEILFFTDSIDEFIMQSFREYKDYRFQNIAKDGAKIGEHSKKRKEYIKQQEAAYESLIKFLLLVLNDEVDRVTISSRLHSSPFAAITKEWAHSGTMQRVQNTRTRDRGIHEIYFNQKLKLEINPRHPIVKKLLTKTDAIVAEGATDEDILLADPELNDMCRMLYEMAKVRSGYEFKDPIKFSKLLESSVLRFYNIGSDEVLEEEPVFDDDDAGETKDEEGGKDMDDEEGGETPSAEESERDEL
jgi:heat shock protein beta